VEFVSIYGGLGEICRSPDPVRKGRHIPWHFLYASAAKYIRTYDFDDKVSLSLIIPKFSGFARAESFELDEAREFISSGTGFRWNSLLKIKSRGSLPVMANSHELTLHTLLAVG